MEMNFNDAGRFDARAQNVLLRRHVVFRAQPLEVIEEASNRATHMYVNHVYTYRQVSDVRGTLASMAAGSRRAPVT